MAQQVLKEVDGSFKSFFGLLKLVKNGQYDNKKIKLPKYLAKDGFTTLVIGFVRLKLFLIQIHLERHMRKSQ